MSTEREAFENEFRGQLNLTRVAGAPDEYAFPPAIYAWKAWQSVLARAKAEPVYQVKFCTDERYSKDEWREVPYSEFEAAQGKPFRATRILYTRAASAEASGNVTGWRRGANGEDVWTLKPTFGEPFDVTRYTPAEAEQPLPMDTAPRDGTMVRLLVKFTEHATEDTEGPAWTIGANNDANVGAAEGVGWQFAGWCWNHDHFTQGEGTPIGWLPMVGAAAQQAAQDPETARLRALINAPEVNAFLRGTHTEAVHQVERWGTAHDRAKRAADWFWLVGYLAGKALHAAVAGDIEKAKHHTISSAAALYNWHCSISGTDVRMCPGRSDLAEMVDGQFPGEAHG